MWKFNLKGMLIGQQQTEFESVIFTEANQTIGRKFFMGVRNRGYRKLLV